MNKEMKRPQKLIPGQKVAALSLSWGGAHAFPLRYEIGKKQIHASLGLFVTETVYTLQSPEWLSSHPRERAEDLNHAIQDPAIAGLFSVIGGNDSIKNISYIDPEAIKRHPKVFIGYSDTTITHLLFFKCGVVSFYGPAILTSLAENGGIFDYSLQSLKKTIMSSKAIGIIRESQQGWATKYSKWSDPEQGSKPRALHPKINWTVLQGETPSRGHLLGGCVETLALATEQESLWPSRKDWDNAVLFLEVSEDSKDEAELLKNLEKIKMAGVFKNPAAILVGRAPEQFLTSCGVEQFNALIYDFIKTSGVDPKVPVLMNLDFGHSDPVFTLPYGLECIVDPVKKELLIPEAAVEA